ncbi:MAG: hypothetical protein AAF657_02320 [Acidobacteriota bacterium]
MTDLDERRIAALLAIERAYVLSPPEAGSCSLPGMSRLRGVSTGRDVNRGREDTYWNVVLAWLALDQLGYSDAWGRDLAEEARQVVRYQFCHWPGGIGPGGGRPWKLRTRLAAIRIYYLYFDRLFPDPSDPDRQLFLSRLESSRYSGVSPCQPLCNTENVMTVLNAYNFLAKQALEIPEDDAQWQQFRAWWMDFLRWTMSEGFQEYGSGYHQSTFESILAIADFIEDPQVRDLATMAVDYHLALTTAQSTAAGEWAAVGVRVYPYEVMGDVKRWSSHLQRVLLNGVEPEDFDLVASPNGIEISQSFSTATVSNYSPLAVVKEILDEDRAGSTSRIRQRGFGRGRNKYYFHQGFVGGTFSIGVNVPPSRQYYNHHDALVAVVQSDRRTTSRAVPIGFHPLQANREFRSQTTKYADRAFGYRNAVVYTQGGVQPNCPQSPPAPDCDPPAQPPRLYLSADFSHEIDGRWLFARNSDEADTETATWIAWRCQTGTPKFDDDIDDGLTYFRSNGGGEVDENGRTCALEAGDGTLFASYGQFKQSVMSRNPSFDGRSWVVKNADGSTSTIGYLRPDGGLYNYTVDGVPQDPVSEDDPPQIIFPRAHVARATSDQPIIDGLVLSGATSTVTLDPDSVRWLGAGQRLESRLLMGDRDGGPVVGLRYPQRLQIVSAVLPIRGYALDRSGVDTIRFEIDGEPAELRSFRTGEPDAAACAEHGDLDPSCPDVGFGGHLDTRTLASGRRILEVIAADSDGNEAVERRVFFVDNVDDTVPILRDGFATADGCGREPGQSLDDACVSGGETGLRWRAGGCVFGGEAVTNVQNESCWGDLPFAWGQDEQDYVGGVERATVRMRVQLDRPEIAAIGADFAAVGFHSGELQGTTVLFVAVEAGGDGLPGSWGLYRNSFADRLTGGDLPGLNPNDWTTLQLTYNRVSHRARVVVNGYQKANHFLGSIPRLETLWAGFRVGFWGSGTSGDFAVDDVEVLADAVADEYRPGAGRPAYTLVKPTSWSASEAIATLGLGGNLATIETPTEHDDLFDRWAFFDSSGLGVPSCSQAAPCPRLCDFGIPGPDGFWIGLTRAESASWRWVDDSTAGYRAWDASAGQPQDSQQCGPVSYAADHAAMNALRSGLWWSWGDIPRTLTLAIVEAWE